MTPKPQGESRPRRWKLWRIDRGEGHTDWAGCQGPATNPPEDCGLAGTDWIKAATVEVVEVLPDPERIEAIADELHSAVRLEDEDGEPAPREHYVDLARQVAAFLDIQGESRVEWRVVYFNAYQPARTQPEAEKIVGEIRRGGVAARIQRSEVTETRTPWEDVDDA